MRAIATSPWARLATLATVAALALTACTGSDESAIESSEAPATSDAPVPSPQPSAAQPTAEGADECGEVTPVSLQLPSGIRAQFGGYFAAKDKGFYGEQCLDVTILEGGPDVEPQTILAKGVPTTQSRGCPTRSPRVSRVSASWM